VTGQQTDALEALKKAAQAALDAGLPKSEMVEAIQALHAAATGKSGRTEEIPGPYVDERTSGSELPIERR
jgi:hypothetical protein